MVGERSYSLYLIQQVADWAIATLVPVFGTPRLLSAVAVVLCSAVMADLVHRWVEQPGIELGRRFVSRPGWRPSAVVPPVTRTAAAPDAFPVRPSRHRGRSAHAR